MSNLFHTFVYDPLYNALVLLLSAFPHFDVGIAVIIFTVAVKLILFPLSKKSVQTQLALKKIEPELQAMRQKFPTDKQAQAVQTMEIYKKHKINPFSGILLLLIQLPILFALYFIFAQSGLPAIKMDILYSFVHAPENVSMQFLGLINIAAPSVVLGFLAGLSQFFSAHFSIPAPTPKAPGDTSKNTFAEDFGRSLSIQAKYVLPVIIFVIALKVSGALALYWIVSNLFTIGQELYLRREKQMAVL